MSGDSTAAQHLAEVDAGYDAHLSALREHAALSRAAVANDADELARRLAPDPQPEPELGEADEDEYEPT